MTLVNKDIAAGIVLVILAVAYWLGADSIPKSLLEGGVGAEALPKMLGILLLILSAVLVLQTILARRQKAEAMAAEDDAAEDDEPAVSNYIKHTRALGLLLIGVGYIILVETVGYIIGIAYLLAAVTLFAGGASRRTVILFAVLGAVFFWVLFVEILGIHQPQGFWPKLWHQVTQAQSISPAHSAISATL